MILIYDVQFRVAMETIQELSDTLNFSDYSSVIVHGLVHVLEYSPDLKDVAMDTLCCLVVQLGHRYKFFIPMMSKVCITRLSYDYHGFVSCSVLP